jgi:hypothetical protein
MGRFDIQRPARPSNIPRMSPRSSSRAEIPPYVGQKMTPVSTSISTKKVPELPISTPAERHEEEAPTRMASTSYLSELLMYRWRYIVGYGVITLCVIWMLFTAAIYIPGSLSQNEMNSTVISSGLSVRHLGASEIVNFPYHALQHISFMIFGITTLSIKLPSLIIALLSIGGMLVLLRMWFSHNIAVLTMILVVSTGQFLLIAQSGTPSIMYVFWSTWLIVAAMMVARLGTAKSSLFWKITLCALITLSLYTPLSIYVVGALLVASFLHPHLRFIVRKLHRKKLIIAAGAGLILLAPLIRAVIIDPSIGLMLLGVPKEWSGFSANSHQLFNQYFDFFSSQSDTVLTPIYGLGSMLLILMGIIRLFSTKYTGRSYIITIWLIMLLPILIINPDYTSITFVPVMLLMAMGLSILLRQWYGLFPRNPYARAVGLVPLSVLIASLVMSGIDHYTNGYQYNPAVASSYSSDLKILNKQLQSLKGPTTIVTSSNELPFYTTVASRLKNHTDVQSNTPSSMSGVIIFTHDAQKVGLNNKKLTIVTNGSSQNADRFHIYQ